MVVLDNLMPNSQVQQQLKKQFLLLLPSLHLGSRLDLFNPLVVSKIPNRVDLILLELVWILILELQTKMSLEH